MDSFSVLKRGINFDDEDWGVKGKIRKLPNDEDSFFRAKAYVRGSDLSYDSHAKNSILVQDGDFVPNANSFEQLKVGGGVLENVKTKMGWEKPTLIQQVVIPVLAQKRDMIVTSPTGSGKTGAFLLPVFMTMEPRLDRIVEGVISPRVLILSPTKELCRQICMQATKLADGSSWSIEYLTRARSKKLIDHKKNCDILIAVPMQIEDFVKNHGMDLSGLEWLILDEVDKLFHTGFIQVVDKIFDMSKNSTSKTTAIFSATLNRKVERLARTVLDNPVRANVGVENTVPSNVTQYIKYVGSEEGKFLALKQLFIDGVRVPALVFMLEKFRVRQLVKELSKAKIAIGYVTSDESDSERVKVLEKFRMGAISVLITTDLLSRGMDFKAVSTVINYDIPLNRATYIHRIGRTGRIGGVKGSAYTFYTDTEFKYLQDIIDVMVESGQQENVPDFLLKGKK